MSGSKRANGCLAVVVLGFAALIGGCSAGDVELNGSVFDKLGVSGGAKSSSGTPQVPIRQGLVVPPDLERLPTPGEGEQVQSAEAFPVNPEQKRVANVAQAAAEHKAYCEKALQLAKVNRDYRQVNGPLGRCDASILDSVSINSPVDIKTGSNPPPKTP